MDEIRVEVLAGKYFLLREGPKIADYKSFIKIDQDTPVGLTAGVFYATSWAG
jgi:hypothetical protein